MAKESGSRKTVPAKKSSNLPATHDDFFATEMTGFEGMDQADLAQPMLKIAQKLSPQADPDNEAAIRGLKPGMFFNPSTRTVYGKDLKIIILGYFRNVIQWGEKLGEFKKAYLKNEFEKIKKDLIPDGMNFKNNEGDKFIDTRNFFIFLPDFPEEGIILFPCSASAVKGARILSSACMTKIIPNLKKSIMYATIWELHTGITKNDDGSWYKFGGPKGDQINFAGYVHEEYKELMAVIKSSFDIAQENIRSNKINEINYSEAGEERTIDNEGDFEDF